MLKKILSIDRVGRFLNSAATGTPQLVKLTLIQAGNGYGKTTFCSILRSLQSGDPAYVLGRRMLGATGEPAVSLLFDDGQVRFQNGEWTRQHEEIAIFDDVFISQNVYLGHAVELDNRRNLYRIIIGQEGVRLAAEDNRLATESRRLTGEIGGVVKEISSRLTAGVELQEFLDLEHDPDIETKVDEQQRVLGAARQADKIQRHPLFSEFSLPDFPEAFAELLATTIDDVAEGAEARIQEHLATHEMGTEGESWVAKGLDFSGRGTCPFCGRGLQGLPLIDAYKAIFGEAYNQLKSRVYYLGESIDHGFDARRAGRLEALIGQNGAIAEFWEDYCVFDVARLQIEPDRLSVLDLVRTTSLRHIERKLQSPLEPVYPDEEFQEALQGWEQLALTFREVNEQIRRVNELIAAKKQEMGSVDVAAAEAQRARLLTVQKRHTEDVVEVCARYVSLSASKRSIDEERQGGRAALNAHTEQVMRPYEGRINKYLKSFNARFRIAEAAHAYPGGIATSVYRLVINNTHVDLGDNATPESEPSFKNTLSGGDRKTLALSFFLASLNQDPQHANKIVVFDDPHSSQDSFRTRQTIFEIDKAASSCAQVIVLSHDPEFLKLVWDKTRVEKVAIQITDARVQGSKIQPLDLERACQGRVASELHDLHAFTATGVGNPIDVGKKLRVVLESYCRNTYPGYFLPDDNLGNIIGKIREAGEGNPAFGLHDDLEQLNDYTVEFHHGDNPEVDQQLRIDTDELHGFVQLTLEIVNAHNA